DEGAATTAKVVEAEPHSYSQLRSRRRHFEGAAFEETEAEPDNSYVRSPFAKPKRPTVIEEKEFLRNFYMEIPEQRFRSSYGSMPSKGARKRFFGKSLEIRKNRSKTQSMLKY
nr:hypothetical protein [Tanacetum cinerariifolium]